MTTMTMGVMDDNRSRRENSESSQSSTGSARLHSHIPPEFLLPGALKPPGGHHIRSSSFRTRPPPKDTDPEDIHPRRNSLTLVTSPNLLSSSFDDVRVQREREKDSQLRRVRSFKTTSKGVINRGDSFKRKNATNSSGYNNASPGIEGNHGRPMNAGHLEAAEGGGDAPSYFKIIILGGPGVGKSTIASQFMTSDYSSGAFDITASVDNEDENRVTVQLDGEETTIEFIDQPEIEAYLEDINADAYLVVFSVTDRSSFEAAADILNKLRHGMGTDRAVVLVGNKCDVVRKRRTSKSDGQSFARQYDCKYTETSAALNHHVDELLVGIIKQIRNRLNPAMNEKRLSPHKKGGKKASWKHPKSLLLKLFKRNSKKSFDAFY